MGTLQRLDPSFRVVYVDDACPEGSGDRLEAIVGRHPAVQLIRLQRNAGQNRAVLTGLRRTESEWVIVMDADLQDRPEDIPLLLRVGKESGAQAVFAGRRGEYESPFRLLSSRVFKTLLSLLTGLPRDAGLFVAMRRPMIERLLAMGGQRPYVVAMIGCSGLPVRSVPVVRTQRASGRSAYGTALRLRTGLDALRWVLWWKLVGSRRRTAACLTQHGAGGSPAGEAPAGPPNLADRGHGDRTR